jgi:hypothetical protein
VGESYDELGPDERLYSCQTCGASVGEGAKRAHDTWHAELDEPGAAAARRAERQEQ